MRSLVMSNISETLEALDSVGREATQLSQSFRGRKDPQSHEHPLLFVHSTPTCLRDHMVMSILCCCHVNFSRRCWFSFKQKDWERYKKPDENICISRAGSFPTVFSELFWTLFERWNLWLFLGHLLLTVLDGRWSWALLDASGAVADEVAEEHRGH